MTKFKPIIPCLDVDHGRVVKGINFVDLRDAGDPVELARRYQDDGANELVFPNITASIEKRNILINVVRTLASEINIPFTVGGGIRSLEDAETVISSGADKVSIGTAAFKKPELIMELAKTFGSEHVVLAIDAKRRCEHKSDRNIIEGSEGSYRFEVYIYGGRKPTGVDA
ncbi:MAG: HisA/HisF-related TIM barrel protein, partial [Thermoproteota archaeon]